MTDRARRELLVVVVTAGLLFASALGRAAPAGPPKAPSVAAAGPSAATASVAVIRPAPGDSVLEEASRRIGSELDAAGMSSRLVDCASSAEAERASCGDPSSAARIALGREEGIAIIRVMASLPDGLELRRHVRVPPEAGGDDPSVLAVRAVELLRDIYLDIPRIARQPANATASERASPGRQPAPSTNGGTVRGRAFLGAGVLHGRWGLGVAAAPVVSFGVSLLSRLSLLATVSGPFHATVGSASEGYADTWQVLGIAQLRYEIGWSRVRPYATAGGGMFSLRAQGREAVMPGAALAITGSRVAPLVGVGVGMMVRIVPWLAFSVDVQEIVTWPVLDVTPAGTVIGRAGGPSDLVQAGLVLTGP